MIGVPPGTELRAIVIGSGSGGLTVAIGLAGLGHRVALVEAGPIGGDCTNVGCIPSKTLLHLARAGAANPFAEVRRVRDGLEAEESTMVTEHELIHLVRGRATFTGPGTIAVSTEDEGEAADTALTAPDIVIATGSEPVRVPIPGLTDDRTLTNQTLFELDAPPASLAIIGGGAISVEMASGFRRLGTTVTVIEAAERILPRESPEASEIIHAALTDAGVAVHVGITAERFDDQGSTLHLSDGRAVGGVDRVLLATGRRPRTEGLGLDRVGLEPGRGGIEVDSWGRTDVDGVWAVGDVTGDTATTHGAGSRGRRTVRAIGLPRMLRLGKPHHIPAAVFCDPEVASVGLSVEELERRWPADARLHLRVDLADTDRGLTDAVTHGAVIVDAERLTGKLLRATIVGPAASEAIGIFTLAFDRGLSLHRLFAMVHPYPTYASAIGAVTDEFSRQTLPHLKAEAAAYLRHVPTRLRRLLP